MNGLIVSSRSRSHECLYPALASGRIVELPEPIRALLLTTDDVHMAGVLDVRHGSGWLARAVARLMRLPTEARHAPVRLSVIRPGGYERWQRQFGDRAMDTSQYLSGSLLAERVGPFELLFAVVVDDQALVFTSKRARLHVLSLAIGLPRCIAPVVRAQMTSPAPAEIYTAVSVSSPLTREILMYSGTMREVCQ